MPRFPKTIKPNEIQFLIETVREEIEVELERQSNSAVERFAAFKRDGNVKDLAQSLFAIGKLAGKVEQLGSVIPGEYANKHKATLITLRDEVENCVERLAIHI